jgi:hypothetical protein
MQSSLIDLRKLVRNIDNRICGDCSAPLGDFSAVFGDRTFGVWLCADCARVHDSLFGASGRKTKSLMQDDWSAEDVRMMKRFTSNKEFNIFYERHIPPQWAKCTSDSSQNARNLWIRAKYTNMAFLLPSPDLSPVEDTSSPHVSLPPKLFDFFLVLTPKRCISTDRNFQSIPFSNKLPFEVDITSCYPLESKTSTVPDGIAVFAYPDSIYLTADEQRPHFFTIVLTDGLGKRQYGGVLQVQEMVTQADLIKMLEPNQSPGLPPNWPILYSVKSLIVLSHYPFFNLFREVLEVLYRTSLSNAPVPMERYVQNIIREVPLPPLGRVDVSFAVSDVSITLWRPPRNQLPMVDFSFRPLFMSLSVDHILLVFAAMCSETKICFCCSNIALLTPIIESFLSFMFPFVWQGAYIPVLPSYLTEILEAPVPFIVGIANGQFLTNMPLQSRPPDVLFVDIDRDIITYGRNEVAVKNVITPLPEKALQKLKSKLNEFGGVIYRSDSRSTSLLRTAGSCFPNNEHLVPIQRFALEVGVIYSAVTPELSATAGGDEAAGSESYRCFVCSSKSTPTRETESILDPNNNNPVHPPPNPETARVSLMFNGREIRVAFLRFFVRCLLDYGDFVTSKADPIPGAPSPVITRRQSAVKDALMTFRSKGSNVSELLTKSSANLTDLLAKPPTPPQNRVSAPENSALTFDRVQFLKSNPDKFFVSL